MSMHVAAGVRNLVQSSSTFAAFVLLPKIAAWTGDETPIVIDDGTTSLNLIIHFPLQAYFFTPLELI